MTLIFLILAILSSNLFYLPLPKCAYYLSILLPSWLTSPHQLVELVMSNRSIFDINWPIQQWIQLVCYTKNFLIMFNRFICIFKANPNGISYSFVMHQPLQNSSSPSPKVELTGLHTALALVSVLVLSCFPHYSNNMSRKYCC